MLRDEVLSLLKQGEEPRSGEEMSRALGVSRAAVWKAVEALRQEGYGISSAPRRGYVLESSPDRLSPGELSGALAGRLLGRELLCLERVDSTNDEGKRRAAAGAAEKRIPSSGGAGPDHRLPQSARWDDFYWTSTTTTLPSRTENLISCPAKPNPYTRAGSF